MNIESVSKSAEEIQGTIINASFPRSGHRFLREIISGYFDDRFVFYESYTKKVINQSDHNVKLKTVNYVKTHDFHLVGREVLFFEFPNNRRYLVQIRHPLESITSYYEFSLKHGQIHLDDEATWRVFLIENLKYWKRFSEIWVMKKQADSLLINYDDLCVDTFKSAEKAILFLTGQTSLDSGRLVRVIEDHEFLQYVGDTESKKYSRRKLKSFSHFNATEFEKIECALVEKYLRPIGIRLLFQ